VYLIGYTQFSASSRPGWKENRPTICSQRCMSATGSLIPGIAATLRARPAALSGACSSCRNASSSAAPLSMKARTIAAEVNRPRKLLSLLDRAEHEGEQRSVVAGVGDEHRTSRSRPLLQWERDGFGLGLGECAAGARA
jgi:hypothetical protein